VVTGAAGGIGRWIALGLTRAGYHVILIGRNQARLETAQAWMAELVPQARVELITADLSLLSATMGAGRLIVSRHPRIALLINNAAVLDANPVITREGHERVLATNLLVPFVLSRVLLPALKAGIPSRIVNIGSSTSDRGRIDPDHLVLGGRWTMLRAYRQSKLALMMTTFALAQRLRGSGVVANVVHPGLVATGLVRTGGLVGIVWRCLSAFALTEEQGADTPLYVALAPECCKINGVYFKNREIVLPNRQALDPAVVERMWAATKYLVKAVEVGPLL
jgi:NAD(P)-dependent dehydrogenase (short-subunit alcohol dehydrogenase family)